MKIKIAENAGFCFGVKRALNQIEKLDNKEDNYILGKLIHNPQVVNELEKKGLKSVLIEDINKLNKNSTIIISAHGVPDKTINNLKNQNFKVIDCTCPLVKKVHNLTKDAEKQGSSVIIFGDKEHTEVKGIAGNLKDPVIISNINEINNISKNRKYCLVSQTTQNVEEFNYFTDKLKKLIRDLKIYDTICIPTKKRQSSSVELAKKSDLMLVVGGKMSANTRRLAKKCSEFTETYHVEAETELKREWFEGKENIGITAGASTPDYVVAKVVDRIKNEF